MKVSTSVRVPGVIGLVALASAIASSISNTAVHIPVQRIEFAWTLVRLLIEL